MSRSEPIRSVAIGARAAPGVPVRPRGVAWLAETLPLLLFGFACVILSFLYGVVVGRTEIFPFRIVADGGRTALNMWTGYFADPRDDFDFTNLPAGVVAKRWVMPRQPIENFQEAYLLTGGVDRFLGFCPKPGCVAVALGRDGHLIHAYPYRPDELFARRVVARPYESNFFSAEKSFVVFGLEALKDGDLIVTFQMENTFPYGGGVARIDRDGHVKWFRQDYTTHWPTRDAAGNVLTIGYQLVDDAVFDLRPGMHRHITCPGGVYKDDVRFIDPKSGALTDDINIFDALAASRYRTQLMVRISPESPDQQICDPLHVNSAYPIGAGLAAALPNLAPDDLLVSVRHLSALVIVGRKDHAIKYFFHGTFASQHGAVPMADGRIILFDNLGASADAGPSRVLIFDPKSKSETTLFPNARTPKNLNTYSRILGHIVISPDRNRALVAFGIAGRGYEIDLRNGTLLTEFDNVHDLRPVSAGDARAEKAARVDEYGMYYVDPKSLAGL